MKDESKSALISIGMDMDQTLARFVGNEGMLLRFLNRFPADTTFEKLEAAMAAGDAEDAFHQAHTLKGVAGNLGLGNLFESVGSVVEDLRNNRMEEARVAYPKVQEAYAQTLQVINSLAEGAS